MVIGGKVYVAWKGKVLHDVIVGHQAYIHEKIDLNFYQDELDLASHAGVFRGARFSSLPTKDEGRDEKRAPLKTPAWEAKLDPAEHTKERW